MARLGQVRMVVLASGTGTLLQSLINAQEDGQLAGQIVAVGSDVPGCGAITRAKNAGLETFELPLAKGADREEWDRKLSAKVAEFSPDLVVSVGFMKLLGANFLNAFGGRCINTHPALLPSFPGMHGVRDALAAGVKVSGATVFMVDDGVDTGKIIAQRPVEVLPEDDEAQLHERIKVVERQLLKEVVNDFAKNF